MFDQEHRSVPEWDASHLNRSAGVDLIQSAEAPRHRIEAPPWTLGPRAVRTLVHTMGRIPPFRAQGWRILTDHGVLDQAVKTLPRCWKR